MLRKKEYLTICVPIPGFVPRQLALDVLHNHSELITLNPLVLSHKQITPPKFAAADEYNCTWYEITERIQYVPGMGKMGAGKINFPGCFHNLPWGLQTHTYAPMDVEVRHTYRVAGSVPGTEPEQKPEIGLAAIGAPTEGLYLRADMEFKCNFTLVSFVRSQLKSAIKEMVDRMIKRAEELDADMLQRMLEDDKLGITSPVNDKPPVGFGAFDSRNIRHSTSNPASPTVQPDPYPWAQLSTSNSGSYQRHSVQPHGPDNYQQSSLQLHGRDSYQQNPFQYHDPNSYQQNSLQPYDPNSILRPYSR